MTDDVKDFVSICERCQRTNDKFTKPGSVLHPIPIEPEVWKQVSMHNKVWNSSTLLILNCSDILEQSIEFHQPTIPRPMVLWRSSTPQFNLAC